MRWLQCLDSKSQQRKSLFHQLITEDEIAFQKLFLTDDSISWAHSWNSFVGYQSMLSQFLHCCESIAFVTLLMPYYKDDLEKNQKCRGLAILTWQKAKLSWLDGEIVLVNTRLSVMVKLSTLRFVNAIQFCKRNKKTEVKTGQLLEKPTNI